MDVQKLSVLAANAVANGIREDKENTVLKFQVDIFSSNQIFENLASLGAIIQVIGNSENSLLVSHADFKNTVLSVHNIKFLSNCDLTLLKINISPEIVGKYKMNTLLDLQHLLMDCLNTESRSKLANLQVQHREIMPTNWMDKMLQMLPNLSCLTLNCNSRFQFSGLSKTYNQLTVLDIAGTRVFSLRGITNLANLVVLNIGENRFRTPADFGELFNLGKLKILDVSENSYEHLTPCRIVQQMLQLGKTNSTVENLDISNTNTTSENLKELVKLFPNLKLINLYQNPCSKDIVTGVETLHANDLGSALQLLRHYQVLEKMFKVEDVLNNIAELINPSVNYKENKDMLHELWNHLMDTVEKYSAPAFAVGWGRNHAINCLIHFSLLFFQRLLPEEQLRMVHCLMRNKDVGHTAWTILNVPGVLETPGLDIQAAYQKCIDFFADFRIREYDQETVLSMQNAFMHLHPMISEEKRKKAERIPESVFGMIALTRHLIQVSRVFGEDLRLDVNMTGKMLNILLAGTKFNYPILFIEKIFEYIDLCDDLIHIKLILVKTAKKLMLQLNHGSMRMLARAENVHVLLKCMLADYTTNNALEGQVAFHAIEVLAFWIKPLYEKQKGFVSFLEEHARRQNRETYFLTEINFVDGEYKRDFMEIDDLEEWAWLQDCEILVEARRVSKQNQMMFAASLTKCKITLDDVRNVQGDLLTPVNLNNYRHMEF